jgi:histidinol dehydrogenase
MKRTTLAEMSPDALRAVGQQAVTLAKSESLEAHGLSVSARLRKLNR